MDYFLALARRIDDEWLQAGRRWSAFPEVCQRVLEDAAPHAHVHPMDIVHWLHTTDAIPPQDLDSQFGQPPVTVYQGSRFKIDVYFWVDGTTSIHDHSFCGAFHLLAGSSIHSRYRFDVGAELSPLAKLGTCTFLSSERLRKGQTRAILPGGDFIHALFHLDRPSVSLVVRKSEVSTVQLRYEPPSLAWSIFERSALLARQLQTLDLIHATEPGTMLVFAERLLSKSDAHTAVHVVHHYRRALAKDPEAGSRLRELFELTGRYHRDLGAVLVPVFARRSWLERILVCRTIVPDEELRFLLALLLNVPTSDELSRLVQDHLPGRAPDEVLANWFSLLSALPATNGKAPRELLELPAMDAVSTAVLRGLVRGEALSAMQPSVRQATGVSLSAEQLTSQISALRGSRAIKAILCDCSTT
jgi:hypothetical protein